MPFTETILDFSQDMTLRHVLLLEYDGSQYCGSQYQEQAGIIRPTLQYAVEQALSRLGIQASKVNFCSRTDAGVHAFGQRAHVDLVSTSLKNIPDLKRALNAVLPADIVIRAYAPLVPPNFNVRRDAVRKWYRYSIRVTDSRAVLQPVNVLTLKHELDIMCMNVALSHIMGLQNFKSFKCLDTLVVDDLCHVEYANVSRDGNNIYFDIVATRFLYKMVRNLAGLLMAVGRNQNPVSPETFKLILDKQDQQFASQFAPTASPKGLTLMAIGYPEGMDHFNNDEYVQQMNTLVKTEFSSDENLFCKAS